MFCYRVVVQFKMGHTECSVTVLYSLRSVLLRVVQLKMGHTECSVTVLL